MAKRYKGILFFDIDGTVVRHSLFYRVLQAMFEQGLLLEKESRDYRAKERAWQERQGSYEDYLWAAIAAFEKSLFGLDAENFQRLAEQVVARYRNQVYVYARDLLKEKQAAGWYTVAISTSPQELVMPFARYWRADEAHGSKTDIKNGRYVKPYRTLREKGVLAAAIIARPEFKNVRPENIWGIGDTAGDICFLELMGRPICFQPDRALRREAEKRGWPIVLAVRGEIYFVNH